MMDENAERFEFPVPMEPPAPIAELVVAQFDEDGQTFYVDSEGYVQVFTHGEGRSLIDKSSKASIGVWFEPGHPK
jgi:hypothetical protein